MKSNCLLGVLVAQRRLGGKLGWWPGWSDGWDVFMDHPWGHFYLDVDERTRLHFAAYDKNLPWWRQLWFEGRYRRSKPGQWEGEMGTAPER